MRAIIMKTITTKTKIIFTKVPSFSYLETDVVYEVKEVGMINIYFRNTKTKGCTSISIKDLLEFSSFKII